MIVRRGGWVAGVVAQGGGNAGCPGQAQDGDDQVACSLNYGATSQLRRVPSDGAGRPACPGNYSWQVYKGVTAARALRKADMRC